MSPSLSVDFDKSICPAQEPSIHHQILVQHGVVNCVVAGVEYVGLFVAPGVNADAGCQDVPAA